jgi:hypothetical protein
MADVRVLIVVDGIFSLTTTYPIDPTVPPFGPETDTNYGPDAWFTLSHLMNTLNSNPSPTFQVDTASRGFNAAGNFDNGTITNTTADPDATIPGAFHFDDPSINLFAWDEIWLFGDEGYDDAGIASSAFKVGPQVGGTGEPGGLTNSELAAITKFRSMPGAWCASARSPPASRRQSATTVFGRPASPRTSPMAARWSTRSQWPRMRALAPPSSTTAPRSGSPRTRSSGS